MTILGRNGERIPIEEYPPGYMDPINARLNAIAAEEDDESGLDRAAEAVLQIVTRGGFAVGSIVAGGLLLVVVAAQVGRWLS